MPCVVFFMEGEIYIYHDITRIQDTTFVFLGELDLFF